MSLDANLQQFVNGERPDDDFFQFSLCHWSLCLKKANQDHHHYAPLVLALHIEDDAPHQAALL